MKRPAEPIGKCSKCVRWHELLYGKENEKKKWMKKRMKMQMSIMSSDKYVKIMKYFFMNRGENAAIGVVISISQRFNE